MSNILLYNSDASIEMKNIHSNSIDCVLTDPPYGVGYKVDFYNDSWEYVESQMSTWYQEWYRVLKDNSYLYLFVGVKTLHKWIEAGIKMGFTFKNILATRSFNNGTPMPKNSFGFQFQPVIVFSKGKGKAYNNVDFFPTSKEWFRDKRNKNPKPFTYEYSNFIPSTITFATEKRSSKNLHPNEKNVKLLKFLVEISTKEGDIVLDSFMGSGSTGVACEQSNRNFIGIELDKRIFEKAAQRLRSYVND